MRLGAAQTLPSPKRLRELTSRVAWGEGAKRHPLTPIVLLPHHADMPRGEAYITWLEEDGQPTGAVGVPGRTYTWRVSERGDVSCGTAVVCESAGEVSVHGDWPPAADPTLAEDPCAVVADGEAALWDLVAALEPHVIHALERANRYVARELEDRTGDEAEGWAETFNQGAVDRVALERAAAEMLYGSESKARGNSDMVEVTYSARDAPIAKAMQALAAVEAGEREASAADIAALEKVAARGLRDRPTVRSLALPGQHGADSVVIRMIRRSATTSINNQPLGSWWAINIRARAEEAVRQQLADPHIGPKVRRFTREYQRDGGVMDIDELLDAYRAAHPRDHAGRDRLLGALSAGKTIDAVSSSLSLFFAEPSGVSE